MRTDATDTIIQFNLDAHQVKLLKDIVQKKINSFQWVIDNKKPTEDKKAFLKVRQSDFKDIFATLEQAEEGQE